MGGGGQVTAIEPADLLEAQPSERWASILSAELRPHFTTVSAQLWLKVNEYEKAFPYIERLASTNGRKAKELADEFLRVWKNNNNPNARNRGSNYIYVYGFDDRANSIPLTRSKQERNLTELAEYVARLRELPMEPVDSGLLTEAFVAEQQAQIGELPDQRRDRFRAQYGLAEHDVLALAQDRRVGDWFEQVVAAGADAKLACNWLVEDLLPALRERGLELDASPVSPERLAEVIALVQDKTLTQRTSRQVLQHLLEHDVCAQQAVIDLGLGRIADEAALQPLVDAAIAALPRAVETFLEGKEKALDALKGHVMKATRGRADHEVVDRLLRAAIARA